LEKITAIIPTFNEEINIEAAIQSVSFADQIIIIDSFSTDRTMEIARKQPVEILQRKFDDFSSQKNYAIDYAKYDWVFVLDADERVTNPLKEEILRILEKPTRYVGFHIYRNFYFLDKKVNYGGWQSDKVIRLFRKKYCRYNGALVHERIKYKGEIGYLKNEIDHFSYRGFNHYVSKLNQYAELQAKSLLQNNKKVTIAHLIVKPIFRFFVHYIVRWGFMDGYKGYILATIHGNSVRKRYIKYWLLKNNLK